jgi:hypothetical protein
MEDVMMTEGTKTSPPEDKSDLLQQIVDRSHQEVTWVRSAYKFAVSIVAIIVAIGLYFSYASIRDLKSDLRQEGDYIQKQLSDETALLGRTLQQDLRDEVTTVRQDVAKRLDDEFKTEEITALIHTKAAERVNAVADELIKVETEKRITPLRKELTDLINTSATRAQTAISHLNEKLQDTRTTETALKLTLEDARKTLNEVKMQSDFIMTVLAAQSDSRTAYNKLSKWVATPEFPLRAQAASVRDDIQRSYCGWMGDRPYKTIEWPSELKAEDFTISQTHAFWTTIPADRARAFVEFVWKHKKLTEEERLSFLHGALADSKDSLQAADKAARILSEHAKVKYNPPFNFSHIEKWWGERSQASKTTDEAANKNMDSDKQ